MKRNWLKKLAAAPKDAVTVGHATWFLQFAAPQAAEAVLLPAVAEISGAAGWLGELYGYGVLGVRGLRPDDNSPVMEESAGAPDTFQLHARASLEKSKDARVVASALATVAGIGRNLQAGSKLPLGYHQLCSDLLARVRLFDPSTTMGCDAPAGPPVSSGSSVVQQARLIRQSRPEYPAAARARRIAGSVFFEALIGKDGNVYELELLSGPLALYEESRRAGLKWEYTPTLVNGQAVDVSTQLRLNFTLN